MNGAMSRKLELMGTWRSYTVLHGCCSSSKNVVCCSSLRSQENTENHPKLHRRLIRLDKVLVPLLIASRSRNLNGSEKYARTHSTGYPACLRSSLVIFLDFVATDLSMKLKRLHVEIFIDLIYIKKETQSFVVRVEA